MRHSTRPRVRCKGSTRVRGIVMAYVEGPVTVNEAGHMVVEDGETVIHQPMDIDPASIICSNCGCCRARIEQPPKVYA